MTIREPCEVAFRAEAERELQDAFDWYETRRVGLGDELLLCVEAAIEDAARHPTRHPRVDGEIRRVLTRRFPYGVFYMLEKRRIVVLAVFHARRDVAVVKRRAR